MKSKTQSTAIALFTLFVFSLTGCTESSELDSVTVEQFPEAIIGLWESVDQEGKIRFEGNNIGGVLTIISPANEAVGFAYSWTAPSQIGTTLPGDNLFNVLFEQAGNRLVLSTVSGSSQPEVQKYDRID